MSLAIARRYARALADVVLSPDSGVEADQVLDQVRGFAGIVRQSAELRNVLLSPAVSTARKRMVVSRLSERAGYHRKVCNFLCVVVDHRRVPQLDDIAGALEIEFDERRGRVRARVASARPLTGAQQEKLIAELARMTGRQVRCECEVDPALVGGVAVRIGSTVLDGSVRGQLDQLRRRLAAG